jgi:hypothetical protein
VRATSFVILMLCALLSHTQRKNLQRDQFIENVFYLSEVMLHDAINPPAASRFYTYSILAAYETARIGETELPDLVSAFHVAPAWQMPDRPDHLFSEFSAMYAMLEVGRQIIPSGYLLEEKQQHLVNLFTKQNKVSPSDIEKNKQFAIGVAKNIVRWAKADGYSQLSLLTRYTPNSKDHGHWQPTPPEYIQAVEPFWKTIRPMMIDSAGQFDPGPPVAFSEEPGSLFSQLVSEVHQTSLNLSDEQKTIAAFWDCNPFAVHYSGHMAIGIKKISPGGHWIGITGIASKQADLTFGKTVLAHALVSIGLFDGFISCWHQKYSSDRIRPETAINRLFDASWRPFLQTPPFPEYTSGHSVVSTASAEILTYLFGENFRYTDTSEEYFGLKARTFNSFREAANEAAISRLYGGIHFRDAIEAGQRQGKSIGTFIIEKLSAPE